MKSEWLIPVTVDNMIRGRAIQIKVLQSCDSWFGLTYPEDKPMVNEKIKALVDRGSYPTPLFMET